MTNPTPILPEGREIVERLRNGFHPFDESDQFADDTTLAEAAARIDELVKQRDEGRQEIERLHGLATQWAKDAELAEQQRDDAVADYRRIHDEKMGLFMRALAAEQREARLREALEPFARDAECWEDCAPDDRLHIGTDDRASAYDITVSDLRAARAALSTGDEG